MKSPIILLIALLSFSLSCSRQPDMVSQATVPKSEQTAAEPVDSGNNGAQQRKVSLSDVDKAESTAEAVDRKIIRNADLTMEVASTTETQHRVTAIAESHGGFVVTSETKQREHIDPAKRSLDIKLVIRVPATQFGSTLEEIKSLAGNIPEAQVTGQDVTEDFIDLEARIKTQKALELQFLAIMKDATEVTDALEVQRQIAEVRTDIEKLEGRKRFLENRSSLSTISVNIQAPKVVTVSATGFRSSLRDAVSDSLEVAAELIVFFVRFAIVMLPVLVFVVLPTGLILRYFTRRAKRMRLAAALATPNDQ